MEFNRGYNEDCIEVLKRMPANSLNIICIDPPYLYLKNQKLERPFNELLFFMLCRRVLKTDGFIICFGRGTSFYRWNTIMAQLGLTFKEEIVWNKSHCTSPLMNIGRVHETISIHTTEKPVRLLERLLSLVVPKQKNVNAADFFGGSFSFAEACINLGINWLVTEIDKEYFDAGVDRVKKIGSTLFT